MKLTELRRLRRAAELTQRELADRAGVSESVVFGAETGRHVPHYGNMEKLAEALGVDVVEILPKAAPPASESDATQGGRHMVRTARSHMEPITSRATVEVNPDELDAALTAVAAGWMTPDAAKEKLLAGVA